MQSITVTELAKLDGATVIDVREPDEYAQVRAAGAVSIPMSQIIDRIDELPEDDTIHLICASGGRSGKVAEYLETRDFDVVNVEGGTYAWTDAGLPVEQG
ncbi:rhodanese-related sulfurtransferase [Okibacterium sp. HSC-33S16]|uniref:rhodanese-like domain-containing protein n=1 Tax=Okibacterium sp. HSC-33S16 TaxID=2910965 RepID=UPI00209E2CBF|nr:rhodanese-like domain-containing protein [Okibacterium sp. HSC-33S16]MCP2031499.1 rhodanese-related sulfurtransferase [Okibacterium sp. HSC-33S16]